MAKRHAETVCKRNVRLTHYSGKSYSSPFDCPVCGRSGRFNLNYLGLRVVTCDGTKFYKRKKEGLFVLNPEEEEKEHDTK